MDDIKVEYENVEQISLNYFGEVLIDLKHEKIAPLQATYKIPTELAYNSSWILTHSCLKCNCQIKIIQNYQSIDRSYTILADLNSHHHSLAKLQELCEIFDNIKLVKVNEVYYLNRIDFEYQHELQRKSSISLMKYYCPDCDSIYLAQIRIGLPVEPDKYNVKGLIGKIQVVQISRIVSSIYEY